MSWCLKWVSNLAYDAQCGKNNEVVEQLFAVVIVFSWLVLVGFYDCHQIHMNHPFSCNTSWMTAENRWPDGFHGCNTLGVTP